MDEKFFLVFDLEDFDDYVVLEIKKLTKMFFDVELIVDVVGEFKYLSQIKKFIGQQFKELEEDFVKFFVFCVYCGVFMFKVKVQFLEIIIKVLKQFLMDSINDCLKFVMGFDVVSLVLEVINNKSDLD